MKLAHFDPEIDTNSQFDSVDLGELIAAEVETYYTVARSKNIELSLDARPATVRGGHYGLSVLVRNLMDNAIRYTSDGGRVLLSCKSGDSGTELSVQDSGVGISMSDREKVIDRFFRAADNTTLGSGLGLVIVKQIAERLGADILIEDGLNGSGVSFVVKFT